MKLEAGQVWRRPDGTRWIVDSVERSGYVWLHNDHDALVIHGHAIQDCWTREVSAEAKRAYADLTGQQEREP